MESILGNVGRIVEVKGPLLTSKFFHLNGVQCDESSGTAIKVKDRGSSHKLFLNNSLSYLRTR